MKLFSLKNTYWGIENSSGKFWSSRDQKWMSFSRVTLYADKSEAERVLNSPKFMLKVDMDTEPHIVKFNVEIG